MSYVTNISATEAGYEFIPLLTVGQEVPEIEGTIGNFRQTNRTFAFAGIPDGIGLWETENFNYTFINHEIFESRESDISSTIPGQIRGARISLFVFDKSMNPIGGKNLIETATDSTGTYILETTTGQYTNTATGNAFSFDRFCSGYLAESGFVDTNGREAPIYFAPEEGVDNPVTGASRSRGWAVTPQGNALALDGLGRYAKEQVYPASQYRATDSDRTVLFALEDFTNGELYMYVGNPTEADPNGFLDGQLYVLKVTEHDFETLPEDVPQTATWTPVPREIALDPTGAILSDWVDAEGRSTNFRRLEDIHEDPNNPGTFYFATTGSFEKTGTQLEATLNPQEADNPYGKLYRFTLNPDDPTADFTIEAIHGGGPGRGVNFDNLTVDSNSNVIVQEDKTAFGGEVMAAENRDGRILSYDTATDTIAPIAELNENAAGSEFNNPSVRGEWESSGIVEFTGLGLHKKNYLFNVQAHTVEDEAFLGGRYVEGGQLVLAISRGNDVLSAEGEEVLYGNRGNDILTGGGLGSNILFGGKDSDTLTGSLNDILLGELGDDVLIVGDGGNNSLTGGAGKDTFAIAQTPVSPHTITDFTSGEDTISLQGVPNGFASLTLSQEGADVAIAAGGTVLARLLGVQLAELREADFTFG